MKIRKFKENLSPYKTVKAYITEFTESLGDTIEDWISDIAKNTKLTEYRDIKHFNKYLRKKALKLVEEKNLPKSKEYILIDEKIDKLEEKIEKLRKHRDEVMYYEASDELMYKFQVELLENDFDSFYNYFIKESVKMYEPYKDYNNFFIDVHPNILNNPKYKDVIDMKMNAKKYNL